MVCIILFGCMWNSFGKFYRIWRKLYGFHSRALVLLVISMIAVALVKLLPLKLPIVAYCSIIGLLVASPISPVRDFVIQAASNINFTAPFTMVGAFAGLAISDQLKTFIKQGWKILIVGIFVMTGTFLGSCIWDQLLLTVAGAI